ncbi:MAG: DinB family protein [candidate division NC10 bacterium]|nr:DinB family protein [candidate division NC10 bacterium]
MAQPEAWLRGPIVGVDSVLMPAAHALVQASEDLGHAASDLTVDELWVRPGSAASVGFHLRHIAGSTDRLLTYARGERLSEAQRQALALEKEPGDPPADAATLVREAQAAIQGALEAIRGTSRETLFAPRSVGRAALPTNVFGLLCHVAEHTQRHTGQLITTAKIVRGLGLR